MGLSLLLSQECVAFQRKSGACSQLFTGGPQHAPGPLEPGGLPPPARPSSLQGVSPKALTPSPASSADQPSDSLSAAASPTP